MRKNIISFSVLVSFFFAFQVKAICPVCTIATGAGVGLSRWLGIDDLVTGVWIGGLSVSLIFWTLDWMDRRNIVFKFRKLSVWAGYLAVIIIPLFTTGIMGHELNKIFGVDKLLLGMIIGMAGFIIGTASYEKIKKKNGGHAQFPFQKVVMAILPLAILSAFFYLVTK